MLTPDKRIPASEASAQNGPEQWVRLARVVRPRGLRGEVFADVLTDFPERFAERRRLFLRASTAERPRPITLEAHRLHQGRLLLKFTGIDSVEAAESLRGHEVLIPRAERAPLEEGAVYIGDLAGCILYDRGSAVLVGEIVDVDRESSNVPLILVRPAGGDGELLIPFAKAYLPHIDLDARRMEMTLPEGLLTLNEPAGAAAPRPLASAGHPGQTGSLQSQEGRREPDRKRG